MTKTVDVKQETMEILDKLGVARIAWNDGDMASFSPVLNKRIVRTNWQIILTWTLQLHQRINVSTCRDFSPTNELVVGSDPFKGTASQLVPLKSGSLGLS